MPCLIGFDLMVSMACSLPGGAISCQLCNGRYGCDLPELTHTASADFDILLGHLIDRPNDLII